MTQGYISRLPRARVAGKRPRSLCVLGSTGSIGRSALSVVRAVPEAFRVKVLAGGRNVALLAEQCAEFSPRFAVVRDDDAARELSARLPGRGKPRILVGVDGYREAAAMPGVGHVLSAQSGAAGLHGTEAAIRAGKTVALANKESLVLAGALLRNLCRESGAIVLPVDSEHNALFQCLAGNRLEDVSRLILTASGGPFFGREAKDLAGITPEQALAHPTWSMGPRISIDSATLMNKGLEIIEACALFGFAPERVEAVIHRRSLVHALVEFSDGAVLAHLGAPDMRQAIAHSLFYPGRAPAMTRPFDFSAPADLSFSPPDHEAFPSLGLARKAMNLPGGTVVLNAADEEAVAAFLERRIGFLDIPACVEHCLGACAAGLAFDPLRIDDILRLDKTARATASAYINTRKRHDI